MHDIPRVGATFGIYRLEGVLGRGGMSLVYRAENMRLGNQVAVKILAPELAEDDTFRERFVRESRVAASIAHPNIIPIFDTGEHEDLLYIVMRYVEGSDLKALLKRTGALAPGRVFDILRQTAGALDAAHRCGLVHRDIKPANILLESIDGDQAEHVYLTDFGLTKHRDSRSGLTQTGQFVGTIDYISPEQVEGAAVDARSDIYSLGCVMFECLTGVVPFDKEADAAVLLAHIRDDPPRVTERCPQVPPAVDEVISKALAKAPDDRHQTAAELVADLARALRSSGEAADARAARTTAGTPAASEATAVAPPLRPPEPVSQTTVQEPAAQPGERPELSDEAADRAADEQRRQWRWRGLSLALALVFAALVAGGGATAAYLLTRESSSSGTGGSEAMQSTAGSTMGTETQHEAEEGGATLANLVPPRIWQYCAEGGSPPKPAIESATCNLVGTGMGAERVRFVTFERRAALAAAYRDAVGRAGVRTGSGACGTSLWGVEGEWLHGPGEVGGRLVCYLRGGSSVLTWSTSFRRILTTATRFDHNHPLLFHWWNRWHHSIPRR